MVAKKEDRKLVFSNDLIIIPLSDLDEVLNLTDDDKTVGHTISITVDTRNRTCHIVVNKVTEHGTTAYVYLK